MFWLKKSEKNLTIKDNGKNNIISIPYKNRFVDSRITINANNCHIIIKDIKYIRYANIFIYNGDNQTLFIDDNVSIEGVSIYCCATNSCLTINKDCMLAAGIQIWTGDGHSVLDKTNNKILNKKQNKIIIGKHVWVAQDVKLLKSAKIPSNSIVGASAVVSSAFDSENVIISGNPAKIVKNNINWDRSDPYQKA